MATPGYPQMMPGGPMPMGGMPRPMRRGAPKSVPVIVGAGLAVGVFCGLLFGVGTGDKKDKTDDKAVKVTATEAAPEGLGATAPLPPPKPTMPAVAAGSGSATGSAATGSAAPAKVEPTVKTAKLVIDIKPDEAAKDAKIQVNGNDITGNTVELPAEQKSVKLAIKTSGYHSIDKTMTLDMHPGDETKIEIEMQKRGAAPAGAGSPGFGGASHTAPTVPKAPPGPPKPPKPKGGGVIDI